VGIVGVDDERNPLAHQGVGDRIDLDLGGVRDLLDTDYDEHGNLKE
jgi:hypothetical protein